MKPKTHLKTIITIAISSFVIMVLVYGFSSGWRIPFKYESICATVGNTTIINITQATYYILPFPSGSSFSCNEPLAFKEATWLLPDHYIFVNALPQNIGDTCWLTTPKCQ